MTNDDRFTDLQRQVEYLDDRVLHLWETVAALMAAVAELQQTVRQTPLGWQALEAQTARLCDQARDTVRQVLEEESQTARNGHPGDQEAK